MKDIAATIHRAIYGHSDKANAPENRTAEWRAGYDVGCAPGIDTSEVIEAEWRARGTPTTGPSLQSFREWKRGMWAGRMQKTCAKFT